MFVVFIVKELNDRYKKKLPVPIPIEVIMVNISDETVHIKESIGVVTFISLLVNHCY